MNFKEMILDIEGFCCCYLDNHKMCLFLLLRNHKMYYLENSYLKDMPCISNLGATPKYFKCSDLDPENGLHSNIYRAMLF